MITDIGQHAIKLLGALVSSVGNNWAGVLVAAGSIAALFLLFWRFLYFKILSLLHPDEPEELPYWIPVLGHALSYFKNADGTLTWGRHYFGDSRKPFAMTMVEQKIYVLTSPHDITEAHKLTDALVYEPILRDLMIDFGTSKKAMHQMWKSPAEFETKPTPVVPNPQQKCLALHYRDMIKTQIQPGPNLDEIGKQFIDSINATTKWNSMTSAYVLDDAGEGRMVSLKNWCANVIVRSASTAFFGETLLKTHSNLLKDFLHYDDNSWMLMFRYPRFLAPAMYRSMENAIEAFSKYFEMPPAQRPGASWFVKALEEEKIAIDMDNWDMGVLVFMSYWVVNANAHKHCFWIIAYLLQNPELQESVRKETSKGISGEYIDVPFLINDCPLLNAVFDEVLRITNASNSIRYVAKDTTIGGFKLRKGANVLMPSRQLSFDESAFGADPHSFSPERFLKDKYLRRSPSFRPFGGGTTYCPGRYITRQETVVFVALILNRFEIRLPDGVGSHGIPELDQLRPSLGIMSPANGADIVIEVKERK